jgi:hypothetical protein
MSGLLLILDRNRWIKLEPRISEVIDLSKLERQLLGSIGDLARLDDPMGDPEIAQDAGFELMRFQ